MANGAVRATPSAGPAAARSADWFHPMNAWPRAVMPSCRAVAVGPGSVANAVVGKPAMAAVVAVAANAAPTRRRTDMGGPLPRAQVSGRVRRLPTC